MLYIPNKDIFNILNSLGYDVSLTSDNIINQKPSITYHVETNKPNLDTELNILYQDIEVVVNVWAESKVKTIEMTKEIYDIMGEHGYFAKLISDRPTLEPNLYHVFFRFSKIKI